VYTERPVTIVITPSNESTVRAGDTVSCSVGENASAADNYTWTDSSTGEVIHRGAEWTIKSCSRQSCVNTGDDCETIDNCVNSTDGLVMLECHVTVGMTTAREAVVLHLIGPETTSTTATITLNSNVEFCYFRKLILITLFYYS